MLVVGSATLAILLVCFSIYQSWQNEMTVRDDAAQPPVRRRTEPSALPVEDRDLSTEDVGERGIGSGENVSITIYPREGSKARLEVEVRDWAPVRGAANEFQLVEPKIRMLTSDDHAVRVTAHRGVLEATRRSGAALEPQRGKLSGGVLIEYDRLTETERAALAPEQRDVVDPAEIVRIEMEEIEFDIEYAKLVIPGPFRLAARDVTFSAANLELHFNESENRVETMRISGGGEVELLQLPGSGGVVTPGARVESRRTVVDWIRQTIQTQLAAQTAASMSRDRKDADSVADAETEKGDPIPVFHAGDLKDDTPDAPVHYFAHFEGDIDATQHRGDALVSRLQADTLDILRDSTEDGPLSDGTNPTARRSGKKAEPASSDAEPQPDPMERITMSWSDRLVLRALPPDDERLSGGVRSRVTATGSPARLSHPEGDAVCQRIVFDPDGGAIWLHGTELTPATVRQRGQGMLTGTVVHTRTEGDRFFIEITGPGELATLAEDAVGTTGPPSGAASVEPPLFPKTRANKAAAVDTQVVSFRDRMQANGFLKSKTMIDFTGHMTTHQYRVLKTATFSGQVSVGQEAVSMDADVLTVRFGMEESWRGIRQYIDGFHGTGHVVMVQDDDRLSCRELDASLTTDHTGRIWPRTVVATGDVDAVQGERTIRARDNMIVDFALYQEPKTQPVEKKPSGASSPASSTVSGAGAANLPLAVTQDFDQAKPALVVRSGVERLRASGEVQVIDATQHLDLSAEELDCHISVRRGEIERAVVTGTADRPASVRMEDVTTIGRRINVNVPDEWVEIPGAGRMSLLSYRDLDGSSVTEPVPIVITWNTGMRYQGRENRAVFGGGVHAYSRSTTTFDCQRLEIEFDEISKPSVTQTASDQGPWHGLPHWVGRLTGTLSEPKPAKRRFNREPAVIWATGHAKAITADIDEDSGDMKTRMRIEGPKLAVYLRPEVSKMLIEGGGALLMEQFQSASKPTTKPGESSGELFDISGGDGPSKTLIEWKDTMVYDFGIDQTRFEGDVSLKHFSGEELKKRLGQTTTSDSDLAPGRSTYLRCDILTVDFLDRHQRTRRDEDRMGRLSTASLRQFEANGQVRLNDTSEGLQVWADKIIYEKPRQLLAIYGERTHKARIIKRRPQRLPLQLDVERLFYNLKTGLPEIADLDVR